jgi:glycosyltransferase involved in cell wall biosynthesis
VRIFHVVEALGTGGVTSVILDLALAQISSGHDVRVFQLAMGDWTDRAADRGIPVETGLAKLCKGVVAKRPDVLHCHQRRCGLVAVALGQRGRTVEHVHNVFSDQKYLSFRGRRVVAVSESVGKHLETFYPRIKKKLAVVRNSADVEAELGGGPSHPRSIIAVGRLEEQKNPLYFLEIVSEMAKLEPELCALWVGDGSLRSSFLDQRSRLGLSEVVEWIPELSRGDVLVRLAHASLAVIASRWEGFPIVGIESLAVGVPVATTECGDIADYVRRNRAGCIIPFDNAKGAAESILAEILLEYDVMQSMRLNSLYKKDFSVEASLERWNSIYALVV